LGDKLIIDDGRSRFELQDGCGTAIGAVDPLLPTGSLRSRKNLIFTYAVLTMLRFRGFFGLHAAALARQGRGCLVVAPSGGGKSTAALSLLRAGWSLVSDDSVLLRRSRGGVIALALRREMYLKRPDAGAPVGEPWQRLLFPDREFFKLEVGSAYPERVCPACTPAVLLFPALEGTAATTFEDMEPADAMFELLEHSTVADLEPTQTPAHVRVLAQLVGQSRALRMSAGSDVLEDPEGFSKRLLRAATEPLGLAAERGAGDMSGSAEHSHEPSVSDRCKGPMQWHGRAGAGREPEGSGRED
jgi:hypothetical protein